MTPRRFGTLRAIGGLAHGLALVPGWSLATLRSEAARGHERRFWRRVAKGLFADVVVEGATAAGPGTLFVSNHVSWLDIPALASVLDVDFIAKGEVQGWPLLGPLSRRTGTVFVARERRGAVAEQADGIAARLRGGDSLVLFAEGTTSDGVSILPFRTSLFAAAEHAACIQPLAIAYRHGDGRPLSPAEARRVGWADEEPMLANARRVSGLHIAARVMLGEPFAPAGEGRKALAERCRAAVIAMRAEMG